MFNATIWLVAGSLLAGDAPAADLKPQVTRLVRQLDATEKSQRDEAEQQLLKLGTPILPLLSDDERMSAEVKLRLTRVRNQLELQRGEEDVQGRRVTITDKPLKLSSAIAQIEKQTGNKLIDYRRQFNQQADDKEIELELTDVPFWSAVDQLLDAAGLTTYGYAGEPGLALVNRAAEEVPRFNRGAYAGAFRVEATEVIARRDMRNPAGQGLRVELEVAWEPRLTPISLALSGESVTAVGDTGEALTPGQNGGLEVTANPGESSTTVPLSFALPPRKMTAISSLKGSLDVVLPGPVETFRFAKLQEGAKAEEKRGAVKAIIENVSQNQLLWEVRFLLVFDNPGQALESHRTWVLHNEAYLEDADGDPVRFAGLETTRQSDTEVGVAYLFDVEEIEGHKFVYKTPTVLMNSSVPFELKGIDLP